MGEFLVGAFIFLTLYIIFPAVWFIVAEYVRYRKTVKFAGYLIPQLFLAAPFSIFRTADRAKDFQIWFVLAVLLLGINALIREMITHKGPWLERPPGEQ